MRTSCKITYKMFPISFIVQRLNNLYGHVKHSMYRLFSMYICVSIILSTVSCQSKPINGAIFVDFKKDIFFWSSVFFSSQKITFNF